MSKRIILMLFLSAFIATNSIHATNVKVTALVEETAPIATDLVGAMVDDPGGTPISKKVTYANLFGSAANIGASTILTVGILDAGSITSNFGIIDNGVSNQITGGIMVIDVDGTAINAAGSITFGTSNDDAIYHNGTNLEIDTSTAIEFSISGTPEADLAADGFNVITGDTYQINNVSVLSATVLGSSVVTSSLTAVSALNSGSITSGFTSIDIGSGALSATGTITGPSGTWDTGGIDIATTDTYAIAGTNVIDNATTFTSTMVTSSLTAVGALASGSIATGFGNIATGGTVTIGVDDTGADVKFFGASAGAFMLYDESEDTLDVRGATAAGTGIVKLTTGELTNVDGGILGRLEFQAPLDAGTTDAILVAASIWAEADATFSASVNTTDLVFATAVSETAAEKMRLTSAGELSLVSGTLTISDGGTVSQGGSRATTVVLNTYSGQITTDTTSLAAGDEATFTVTNSVVTALDVVCVSFGDIPDADAMHVISVTETGTGSFEITYSNVSANADTGANVINFVVLRGASS